MRLERHFYLIMRAIAKYAQERARVSLTHTVRPTVVLCGVIRAMIISGALAPPPSRVQASCLMLLHNTLCCWGMDFLSRCYQLQMWQICDCLLMHSV